MFRQSNFRSGLKNSSIQHYSSKVYFFPFEIHFQIQNIWFYKNKLSLYRLRSNEFHFINNIIINIFELLIVLLFEIAAFY